MRIWGITGTNGKTTTTWILNEFLGGGYITTVEVFTGSRRFSTGYTTPPFATFKAILDEMEANGVKDCAMEVSSHAIHQRRTGDVAFAGGAFSNLTEDHLDYHKNMESYYRAKEEFFLRLADSTPHAPVAICVDGAYGRRLFETCSGLPLNAIACGLTVPDDVDLAAFIRATCPLVGDYNVQNVLLAAALARGAGMDVETIRSKIPRLTPRWGRLERVRTRSASSVYVDYAHTDDALANVLSTVKSFTKGKVWAVFGAGGDRDRSKRPLMGAAAARFADRLVVTSDNPRGEDPLAIIEDIVGGMPAGTEFLVEPDRGKAIRYALSNAMEGDAVVVCGKGHETTQEIAGVKHPFDDREVCRAF